MTDTVQGLEPTAQGNLSKTPFAHVLVYLREKSLTGTLVLEDATEALPGESLVTVEAGVITQIRFPVRVDTLGEVLVSLGAIQTRHLDEVQSRMDGSLPGGVRLFQGELLLAMGAATMDQLRRGLQTQLQRKCTRLFSARSSVYRFYGQDLLAEYGSTREALDVRAALWAGVQNSVDPRALDSVLARVGKHALRVRSAPELQTFGFGNSVQPGLELLLTRGATLQQLSRTGLSERDANLLAYVLMITRAVELQSPTASAAPPSAQLPTRPPLDPAKTRSSKRPPPPSNLTAEQHQRLREAEDRLELMLDETYYQMLAIDQRVSADAVREAFMAQAARWHPDRVPEHLVTQKLAHQRIFALLSEAHATLTDEKHRGRYLASVQDGGGTPNAQRRIAAVLEAATDVQKAEICFKRREYAEAERYCRSALAITADDPNALCVLSSTLFERDATAPPLDEIETLLQAAVTSAPKHDRAWVLLGNVLRRKGQTDRAAEAFRTALGINPKNLDAAREVRVLDMRSRSSVPAPAVDPSNPLKSMSGFFQRFLKKDEPPQGQK